METLIDQHDSPEAESDVFIYLIFGLYRYLNAGRLNVSDGLRHALHAVSFAKKEKMPKTLYHFIKIAHKPVSEWYPFAVPPEFNRTQPLLYDHALSEEAQEYHMELSERLEVSPERDDIPQSTLDNLIMQKFREHLQYEPNQVNAQILYETVRLFLISESWTTLDTLRSISSQVREAIRPFYQDVEIYTQKTIRICERCGLLYWRDNRWEGIKPGYCSDHADGSPLIRDFSAPRQFMRLKEGIHLRTFIPGRIELALFEFADEMLEKYPDELLSFERYPGIDTYDLRLTFKDNDIWAVDAKDQAYPYRLAKQITAPYGEGRLSYARCFFVLPDERYTEEGYIDDLERELARRNATMLNSLRSLSAFKTAFEEKLKSLTKRKRRQYRYV